MIKKSAYRPVGFRVPQNYVDKIEPKGVDFSSPQMEANKDRGVYSINYRYNGKKGEKRWGYQKVGYVPEGTEHNPIFGMWSFVGGVTNTKRTIALAGKNFYEATYDGRWHFRKLAELDETPVGITKESAVAVGNYLYLLAGGELYRLSEYEYGAISIEVISGNLNAYVPTTTTNIAPINATTAPSVGYTYYEAPNSLSKYRKNELLLNIECLGDAQYLLDSLATEGTIKILFYKKNGSSFNGRIVEDGLSGWVGASKPEGYDLLAGADFIILGEANSTHYGEGWTLVDKSGVAPFYGRGTQASGYKDCLFDSEGYGTPVIGYGYYENGGFFLGDSKHTMIAIKGYGEEGLESAIVQFESDYETVANVVKCRYFARFGHNNKLNTLFAYGNPEHPNYLYNSVRPEQAYEIDGEVHNADEDFTYWPTDAYRKLGEPNSKIVGAEVVSESKMMVLKTKGGNSPTMYFISPIVVTKDMDGDSETTDDSYTIAEYSTFQSNTTTAGIVPNPDGICNLNGDILFFSNEKQVAGLDIEGITGDSRRAANTRSAYIDRELAKLDPASVKLFAFGNYLILDSDTQTYCCHLSQYSAETRQYEWWAIDNINATFFYEDDDGNAFYTDDKGGIYQLEGHTDIERYFINDVTGDLGFFVGELPYLYTDKEIRDKVCEGGWTIRFDKDYPIYGRIWDSQTPITDVMAKTTWGPSAFVWFYLKPEYMGLQRFFTEGKRVLLKSFVENTNGFYQATAVVHSVYEDDTHGPVFEFEVLSADENFDLTSDDFLARGCVFTALTWSDYEPAENKKYYEFEVKAYGGDNDSTFCLKDESIISYLTPSMTTMFNGEFSKETPVKSMWISRPVPLAKFSYDKTIKQVDVYNDTQEPAELYIGCITNKQLHTYQYARIEAFDLGNIDFENTTFDQNRVPVIYHMRRFPRKHQYFSLVQMSTGTDNSLLSDMDITYTLQGVARNKK